MTMVSAILPLSSVHGQGTFELSYNLNYTQLVYPGGSTILGSIFTNGGTVQERVTGLTVTADFGTFTASSGLPLYLAVGQRLELNMTSQIPSSTSTGTHAASASVAFQYSTNGTTWITPSQSPLVIQGSISIVSNPSGLAAIGYVIFGVIAALAFAVVYLVARIRRKPKAEPTPPSLYPPPTPPGPLPPP